MEKNFTTARQSMHDGQLRPNAIHNPSVLQAFLHTPRHLFTTSPTLAYADAPAPIAPSRVLPAPMATARLIQELDVQPTQHVLVIAGGTGYSTAILATMAQHVTHVEDDASLLTQAKHNHQAQHLTNITYTNLSPTQAPAGSFNCILVDAPTATLCPTWLSALAPGGKLACLLANAQGVVQGTLVTQASKTTFTQTLFDTKTPLHPQLTAPTKFVF